MQTRKSELINHTQIATHERERGEMTQRSLTRQVNLNQRQVITFIISVAGLYLFFQSAAAKL